VESERKPKQTLIPKGSQTRAIVGPAALASIEIDQPHKAQNRTSIALVYTIGGQVAGYQN
jgi:hypothetical protein